jgi:hypothetical protein
MPSKHYYVLDTVLSPGHYQNKGTQDKKFCFIMLPPDTLQNLRQVITALEMATIKI